ncbi:MAG: type 1 glutamine amidotransferase [Pseudomonadota bacterium]
MRELTIGILETGPVLEPLLSKYGTYPAMFEKLLEGRGFAFRTYSVMNDEFPETIDSCDGWLITGSRFGAYEDHDWIPPLEAFLRGVYGLKVPLVGICFGHQILAQALGGKVIKHPDGWVLGRVEYDLEGFDKPVTIMGLHQDQVIAPPPVARIAGMADGCAIAALDYGPHAWTLQPHPEFREDFFVDLLEQRKALFPAGLREGALEGISGNYDTQLMADKIEAVLKSRAQSDVAAE